MPYRLQWTERKNEKDHDAGFGIGPRFHYMFCNAKVIAETDRTITFERITLGSEIAAYQSHHLKSWAGNFDVKVEKVKKAEKKKLKAGCPVCLQEVDTYIDEGIVKLENHNYRDSDLQCPGGGDEP